MKLNAQMNRPQGQLRAKSARFALLLLANTAHAGPRVSADCSVSTESLDAGGQRVSSASYTHDGSFGGITGISGVVAPVQSAKHGYISQLTEVTALQLAATPTTVNETSTRQLSAAQLLDDGTIIALPAGAIAWSVLNGPLSSISASGLATASTVYQDTSATAKGDYAGASGTLGLTVLNILPDNYGTHAGDGLDDDWQVRYFGLSNPLAAALLDPDGDGQSNAFEFTAGLVPTDPLSRFSITIAPVPGQPTQKQLVFVPIVAGRSYTVMTSLDLDQGSWSPLAGAGTVDNGTQRTVTDPAASETKKFYRVEIEKP